MDISLMNIKEIEEFLKKKKKEEKAEAVANKHFVYERLTDVGWQPWASEKFEDWKDISSTKTFNNRPTAEVYRLFAWKEEKTLIEVIRKKNKQGKIIKWV